MQLCMRAFVAISLLAAAAAPAEDRKAASDPGTPEETIRAFQAACKSGDVDGVRKLLSPPAREYLDATESATAALFALRAAMLKAFKDDAGIVPVELKDELKQLQSWEITGTEAKPDGSVLVSCRETSKSSDIERTRNSRYHLRKIEGRWTITPEDTARGADMQLRYKRVAEEVAKEIEAGKLKTAKEAVERMQALAAMK